jgi:hypothetical protein
MVQKRETTISAVIPLFRVIIHALENGGNSYPEIRKAIINGLKKRMNEQQSASGETRREAWDDNRFV